MSSNEKHIKELLDKYLTYQDGKLYWKVNKNRARKGQRAGSYQKNSGYRTLCIDNNNLLEHRAVFLMHKGYLPPMLDHINRIKDDNRIENLREVTESLSNHNRSSWGKNAKYGRNVCWHPRMKKYRVQIQISGKQMLIGEFDHLEDAQDAAEKVRDLYSKGEIDAIKNRQFS